MHSFWWMVLSLSLALPTFGAEGFSDSKAGLPTYAQQVWSATVRIERMKSFTQVTGWGTGFVIEVSPDGKKALIVTNAHVIHADDSSNIRRAIFLDENSSERSSTVKIIKDFPNRDLSFVVAEIPKKVSLSPVTLDTNSLGGGEEVLTLGYPYLHVRDHWNVQKPANLNSKTMRYSRGEFLSLAPNYPFLMTPAGTIFQATYIHNADILPGNSGGPLLNSLGHVIGVMSRFVKLTTDYSNSVHKYDYCSNLIDPVVHTPICKNLSIPAQVVLDTRAEITEDPWQ